MLTVKSNLEAMKASKQRYSSPYTSIIGCRKVVVAEKDPTGP